MINKSAIGNDWDDIRKELFTLEEIAESDLRVAAIRALIDAQEEKEINQKIKVKGQKNQMKNIIKSIGLMLLYICYRKNHQFFCAEGPYFLLFFS